MEKLNPFLSASFHARAGLATLLLATCALTSASIAQCVYFDQFIENGDGSVTDPRGGLRWKKCAEGQQWSGSTCNGDATIHTWEEALRFSDNNLTAAGQIWRLPTVNEFKAVMGDWTACIRQRPLRQASQQFSYPLLTNGSLGDFWSLDRSDSGGTSVDMTTGMVSEGSDVRYPRHVRLVAGGDSATQTKFSSVWYQYVLKPKQDLADAAARQQQMLAKRQSEALAEQRANTERERRREAEENRLKAVLSQKSPQSMYLSAGTYRREGDTSRANVVYRAIIDRFPTSEWAIKANDQMLADQRTDSINSATESARAKTESARANTEASRGICEAQKRTCYSGCPSYRSNARENLRCESQCNQISCN